MRVGDAEHGGQQSLLRLGGEEEVRIEPGHRLETRHLLPEDLGEGVEVAVREGRISFEESGNLLKFYEEGLGGYTYLE